MDEDIELFLDAVMDNNLDRARSFLDSGINADAIRGSSPALLVAAEFGHLDMVKLLIAKNATVNKTDTNYGRTALMSASERGDLGVVRVLIDSGAKINLEDTGGNSALAYAKRAGKNDVMVLLLEAGARAVYPRTVLVMGAGFTKAFLPGAPLLVEDYDVTPELTTKYHKMLYAYNILKDELQRHKSQDGDEKRVDMERLMTRLVSGMPYDRDHDAHNQLAALLTDVKDKFIKKISQAKEGTLHLKELHDLALICLIHHVSCITFNYDDVFDEALWDSIHPTQGLGGWSPNTGYGITFRSSEISIDEPWRQSIYDDSNIQLLKIHGSLNWRIRRGATEPFRLDDIVHHTPWYLRGTRGRDEHGNHIYYTESRLNKTDLISKHLEKEPFIVPPILTKASLNQEPLLRSLWLAAHGILGEAERIIFVGYSLPVTDIAASFLFAEAIRSPSAIHVVDYVSQSLSPEAQNEKKQAIKQAYRRIFPDLPDDCFRFDGARSWAQDFVAEYGGTDTARQWATKSNQ